MSRIIYLALTADEASSVRIALSERAAQFEGGGLLSDAVAERYIEALRLVRYQSDNQDIIRNYISRNIDGE